MSDPREIIGAIRDGRPLAPDLLKQFVTRMGQGEYTDAQVASFAMAVLLRPLDHSLRSALTSAMRDSGRVLEWADGPAVVDKHSTGGVGDATSFIVAPILAACGLRVPMMSGRGLGHTGGTLDKLEAIEGLRVDMSAEAFQTQVNRIGLAIVSASEDMAPADKRLYRIRDEAACVPSIDLITSSILSKKLAEGAQALVLDVKLGTASFLTSADQARALAQAMVSTAHASGVACRAVISDMNQPLASAIGHRVELAACLEVLKGQDLSSRLARLSCALAAQALVLGRCADDIYAAHAMAQEALTSGTAAEAFQAMVTAQGGGDILHAFDRHSVPAPLQTAICAPDAGYVSAVDPLALAQVTARLGGAKSRPSDQIDMAVGISDLPSVGDYVNKGDVIATLHARTDIPSEVSRLAAQAITLQDAAVTPPALIYEEVQ